MNIVTLVKGVIAYLRCSTNIDLLQKKKNSPLRAPYLLRIPNGAVKPITTDSAKESESGIRNFDHWVVVWGQNDLVVSDMLVRSFVGANS